MMTVHEVSRLTGISIRALHHYDEIGLLKPAAVTEAGYRLYDEAALARLHDILLFKELDFSLKDIRRIMENPDFDRSSALSDQIAILEAKKKRLENLISMAHELKKGLTAMNFKPFDDSALNTLREEAKERWGETSAWRESEEKAAAGIDQRAAGEKMMDIFGEFGKVRSLSPSDEKAQALVYKLKEFITANFYNCTDDILFSLGQMYTGDERFMKNIDSAGGDGTAEFVKKAIAVFCGR